MRGNRFFKLIDRFFGIPLVLLSFLWARAGSGTPPAAPRRILVIKFSALGDAILLVPTLREIRKRFPDAEVIVLGTNLTIPVLRQFNEYCDDFVMLDPGRIVKQPWYLFSVVAQLRRLKCDAVLDFEQWMRLSAILGSLCGATFRAGFATTGQWRHFSYTTSVHRDAGRHEAENFLAVAGLLTGTRGDPSLEMKIDEGNLVKAQGFLMRNGWKKGSPVIILHPGCGSHGFPREWPPERYGELTRRLGGTTDALVVVSGTEGERPVMASVERSVELPVARYEIQTIGEFTALVSLASLFVSSNNGAMHLAAALKIPQIALHGPTNARRWGPLNPHAVVIASSCPQCPCLDLGFEYHRRDGFCMNQIETAEVWEKARHLV